MKTFELDNKKTEWQAIPGGTNTIVAYFKDGSKEKMSLFSFLAMGRKRNKVIKIDCYSEGETIKED